MTSITKTHIAAPLSNDLDLTRRLRNELPAEFETRVQAGARVLRSPCGRGQLVWRRWGDSARTPLILLHGGFGSWRHYALNVLALAKHFCVYAVDLPGLGDSAPLDTENSAAHIAATVSSGIDRILPPEMPFHICGFSFGGIISGPVAVLQGVRVLSYTGVAPGALGLSFSKLPKLASPRPSMRGTELAEVHRHNLQHLMIHEPSRVDELAVHLQSETVRRARSRSGDIPTSNVLAEALPQVASTTRINAIWGDRDAIAGEFIDERRAFFAQLPHRGEFHVIKGAGHWLMFECPATFESALMSATGGQP